MLKYKIEFKLTPSDMDIDKCLCGKKFDTGDAELDRVMNDICAENVIGVIDESSTSNEAQLITLAAIEKSRAESLKKLELATSKLQSKKNQGCNPCSEDRVQPTPQPTELPLDVLDEILDVVVGDGESLADDSVKSQMKDNHILKEMVMMGDIKRDELYIDIIYKPDGSLKDSDSIVRDVIKEHYLGCRNKITDELILDDGEINYPLLDAYSKEHFPDIDIEEARELSFNELAHKLVCQTCCDIDLDSNLQSFISCVRGYCYNKNFSCNDFEVPIDNIIRKEHNIHDIAAEFGIDMVKPIDNTPDNYKIQLDYLSKKSIHGDDLLPVFFGKLVNIDGVDYIEDKYRDSKNKCFIYYRYRVIDEAFVIDNFYDYLKELDEVTFAKVMNELVTDIKDLSIYKQEQEKEILLTRISFLSTCDEQDEIIKNTNIDLTDIDDKPKDTTTRNKIESSLTVVKDNPYVSITKKETDKHIEFAVANKLTGREDIFTFDKKDKKKICPECDMISRGALICDDLIHYLIQNNDIIRKSLIKNNVILKSNTAYEIVKYMLLPSNDFLYKSALDACESGDFDSFGKRTLIIDTPVGGDSSIRSDVTIDDNIETHKPQELENIVESVTLKSVSLFDEQCKVTYLFDNGLSVVIPCRVILKLPINTINTVIDMYLNSGNYYDTKLVIETNSDIPNDIEKLHIPYKLPITITETNIIKSDKNIMSFYLYNSKEEVLIFKTNIDSIKYLENNSIRIEFF